MARLSNYFPDPEEKQNPIVSGENIVCSLLLVDDEQSVIHSLKRVFRDEDYRIVSALSGEEGLNILEKENVQVILSDHKMPGMSGAEFLGIVKEKYPATIRIMLTGYADISAVMGAINTGAVYKFITKPWNDEDLRTSVRLAFEQCALLRENIALRKQTQKRQEEINKLARYIGVNRSQLLHILCQNGLLNHEQKEKVQKAYSRAKKPYPTLIEEMGYASFAKIARLLKARLGIETVAPNKYTPSRVLIDLFPEEFCRRNLVIPLKRLEGRKLLLGMADPADYALIEDVRFNTDFEIIPALAQVPEIEKALNNLFGTQSERNMAGEAIPGHASAPVAEYDPYESIEVTLEDDEAESIEEILKDSADSPVVRAVNLVLRNAIKASASDIHIEKRAKYALVRFRINGLMEDRMRMPEQMHQALVSRIKTMAEMDISERRRPQKGKITVKTKSKTVEVRISSLPTISGEKVVMKLLDRNTGMINLEDLGVEASDARLLKTLMHKPQGLILATGPKGSGKTSTLYSILNAHRDSRVNYITIEDPAEYCLEYASQVLVKEKIGLNFADILRDIEHQDPDVILLGEIEDFETADMAFRAALAGHLVLSSLHANSAVAAVSHLLNMGVKPRIISSGIEGIIAQRLVRRLCPDCREEIRPALEILQYLGNPKVKRAFAPKGCARCEHTGYSGRVGIFEIFLPTHKMRKLIAGNYSEEELLGMVKLNGLQTLLESGISKVNDGVTTLDEISRVLGSRELTVINCPSCRAPISDWMLFCTACGLNVRNNCPNCGTWLEPEWKYCPRCDMAITPKARRAALHIKE